MTIDKKIYELHAEICKSLASPRRLAIINILGEGEKTVTQICEKLNLPKANISQHLAVLRAKGIVTTQREGLHIIYKIANPKIIKACGLMREVLFESLKENKKLLTKYKK